VPVAGAPLVGGCRVAVGTFSTCVVPELRAIEGFSVMNLWNMFRHDSSFRSRQRSPSAQRYLTSPSRVAALPISAERLTPVR
jgi:hypothetical protein